MYPSPAERFHLDQQQRWIVEQQADAEQAAYAAAVQALHRQQAEAAHLAQGGRPVRYVEHRIEVGTVATTAGGEPHRVQLPFACGTAVGIVLGVESGSIDSPFLWYRLAHTLGGNQQWSAIVPIGPAQQSWRALSPDQLGMARYFGPFADTAAVELSPRDGNFAESVQIAARWEGTVVLVGLTTPD